MDADVARMMADLGLARRDYVSAPEEERRNSRARHNHEDAILIAAEQRRSQCQQVCANDPSSAVLSKWNSKATFGEDEVAEALENRYNGQGHRAALQQKMLQYHDQDREPRDGPPQRRNRNGQRESDMDNERHLYMTSRQRRNHTFAPPRKGSKCPRPVSPRSFGVVRFGPRGIRREQRPHGEPRATKPLPRNIGLENALAEMRASVLLDRGLTTQAKRKEANDSSSVPGSHIVSKSEDTASARTSALDFRQLASPAVSRTPDHITTPPTQIISPLAKVGSSLDRIPKTTPAPLVPSTANEPKTRPAQNVHRTSAPTCSSGSHGRAFSCQTTHITDGHTSYKLTAEFRDVNGTWLGTHHYPVRAPVTANITITSQQHRYDPRELADELMNMANAMRDRSRCVKGFEMSVDDVWEEIE